MADLTRVLAAGSRTVAPAALPARFAVAAAAAGLLDVGYATYDAPFGSLVLGATTTGLVRVAFDPLDAVLLDLSARLSPRLLAAPARLDGVRRELDEYFAGTRSSFEVAIDLTLARTPFQKSVLAAADAIPYGQVRSYSDVTRSTGRPAAVRAVGSALGANPVCIVVPCHRVLRSDGTVSGYAGGPERKEFLLRLEAGSAAQK
ncbi:MAG: methylated-DNA--[protein]-cysteine S-methyltransferase [Mycobacteriales bacterium]